MFTIEYDLQSFLDDLDELEKKGLLGNWTFITNDQGDFVELELENSRFKDAGFFEVIENRHHLEFRFFFNDKDGDEDESEDEEIFSFYYTKLFQLILSRIVKEGDKIRFDR